MKLKSVVKILCARIEQIPHVGALPTTGYGLGIQRNKANAPLEKITQMILPAVGILSP